jgi:hypothetical protein
VATLFTTNWNIKHIHVLRMSVTSLKNIKQICEISGLGHGADKALSLLGNRRLGTAFGTARNRYIVPNLLSPATDLRRVTYLKDEGLNQVKAVPLQAWRGPEGSRRSRLPDSAHEGGRVVSHTHRPRLPPRKYSWYLFPLEAESTPGP